MWIDIQMAVQILRNIIECGGLIENVYINADRSVSSKRHKYFESVLCCLVYKLISGVSNEESHGERLHYGNFERYLIFENLRIY